MVAGLAAGVAVEQRAIRADHEDSAELPGIALHLGLAEAAAQRAHGVERQPRREELDAATAQARRTIGAQLGIHEQRTVQREVLTEGRREVSAAVSDDHELGAPGADVFDPVAQLRDLLAAEQSAEVADEDEDDRAVLPEIAESLPAPPPVGELDAGELGCQSHAG